jgi:hypothetical protein
MALFFEDNRVLHTLILVFVYIFSRIMLFQIFIPFLLALQVSSENVHTYHSRVILEGVAELSQISLRDAHVLPKLFSYEIRRPIAVYFRCICYLSFSRLLRHPRKNVRGAILLFCPGHHTRHHLENVKMLFYRLFHTLS